MEHDLEARPLLDQGPCLPSPLPAADLPAAAASLPKGESRISRWAWVLCAVEGREVCSGQCSKTTQGPQF